MILSWFFGLKLGEKNNPFLRQEKHRSFSDFLAIAIIVGILSFISTYITLPGYLSLFLNLLIGALIPIWAYFILIKYSSKRRNIFYALIVILIGLFYLGVLAIQVVILPMYRPGYSETFFPPLSYPFVVMLEKTVYDDLLGFSHYSFTFWLFLPFPIWRIPFDSHSELLRSFTEADFQFIVFVLLFIINYITTLFVLRFQAKWFQARQITKEENQLD